jgi:hypothetical protein
MRILPPQLFIGSERLYFNKEQTILGNENAAAIMPMLHTNPAIMTLSSTVTDFLLIIGSSSKNSTHLSGEYLPKPFSFFWPFDEESRI